MLVLIVAILIIVLVLWWQKPAWLSKDSRDQVVSRVTRTTSQVMETTKETVGKTGERLGPVLSHVLSEAEGRVEGKVRLPSRHRPDLDKQFRDWMKRAELDRRTAMYKALPADAAEFTTWLQALGDKDLGDFTQELAGFCTSQGFDLAWLVDSQVPGELGRAVEETVGLFCLSVWKSRDLKPFVAYRAWLADPGKKENQAFAQRLYSRLAAEGIITPQPDLLYAPEKERQAYVAKALDTVATQDPKTFVALLRDVASELAAVKVEAESTAIETKTPPAEEIAPAAVVAA